MKTMQIAALLAAALLILACSKEEPAKSAGIVVPAPTATMAEPAVSAAPVVESTAASAPGIITSDGPTRYVDHASDEIEFALKKSVAGLESLLEDVSDAEQMASMKQELADLQAKLDAL